MKSSRNIPAMQLKVGTLIAVSVSVALLAMIFPTKGVNLFSSKFTLVSTFPAVAGLRASSPVWFSGVEVGSVTYVDFEPGSNPPRLKVIMRVERKIQPYLRRDAKAAIKGMGLLGDQYIDLQAGSAGEMVADGAEIEGIPTKEWSQDLERMLASAQGMLQHLDEITGDLAAGRGALGQLLKDPSLYPALRDTVEELKHFVAGLNRTEGSAQKLMRDPALYDELVAAVRDIRAVVADLKQAEEKVLSPETRQNLDETVKVASRVVKRVGEYQEKIDKIRFDLNFGLSKFTTDLASGHAHLAVWPNDQRYYVVGLQKVSRLYGLEEEQTTFDAQLAWRIFSTPLFIRGGLTRSEYFNAGLDLRLQDDAFKLLLDAYRVEYNPVQMDVQAGVLLLDLIELTAGVEDVFRTPYYKAGITLHYRDDDLLNVIFKTQF